MIHSFPFSDRRKRHGFHGKQEAMPLIVGFAACLLCTLQSCNIFNPGGDGDYPDNADAHIELGKRALQSQDFEGAYQQFARALSEDSTKSIAYQGLAKAELGRDSFALSELVALADTIGNASDSSILNTIANKDSAWINHNYRPLMRVKGIYDTLTARDTTGRTDGIFRSGLISAERSAIGTEMAYFILFDIKKGPKDTIDTILDGKELATMKLLVIGSSGLAIDTTTDLTAATVSAINAILSNVSSVTSDSALMSMLLGTTAKASGDTTSSTAMLSAQATTFLGKVGTASSFYLMNDSLDNDGDGCINEESGSGTDDDGDSLSGEDSKISAVVPDLGALVLHLHGDSLKARAWIGTDASWIGSSGKFIAPLHWISITSTGQATSTDWTNKGVYDSIATANFGGSSNLSDDEVEAVRQSTRIQIRQRILAIASGSKRIAWGKAHIGGCWDHVQ